MPEATTLLKNDHAEVKKLLKKLDETTERGVATRRELLAKIETELKIHTTIEEEIFYPAFRDAAEKKEDKELFFEATEEHHVVDLVLPELKKTDPSTPTFTAKAKVLKDLIEHHADEEEKEMFPRAKKLMDKDELEMLGERMEQRKQQLKSSERARSADSDRSEVRR
ncbi:MAG TPA: hemerythrin domain-containing protein [Thermoanaerobaculia bacterium]|nr:hemerythrin domain-containing protein [Thermoanaerobaculia bacterium]